MLYERWCQVARTHSGRVALHDWSARRRWTFGELAMAAEQGGERSARVVYPDGNSAAFVLEVLRGWRQRQIICPLETGQAEAEIPTELPPGTAHLKLTSATTGVARLIAFTAEQLAADAENITATMGLRAEWPNVGVISLAHSYGFSNLVTPLLLHGIPLVVASNPLPETVRRMAQVHPAVTVPAVPALWRAWHDAEAIPPNVKLAISAGAPLPLALEESVFQHRGLKIHNFYGSSECGGIAYDARETPRHDAAFAGTPMRHVRLSVAEDDGCLVVQSAAVGMAYVPEADPRLGRGRFKTNDVAELLDGHVYLRGRAGDVINVAGRKLSPETIEAVLAQHAAVRACLVFGVAESDAQRHDRIVACVVAAPGTGADILREFLLAHLPAWQVPRDWWFVDELAPNARGKISRAEWRQRYLAERTR